MLKTGMYNKLEEMKNGGYTLFSNKARKMLLAMGLSLLSIGTLSQVANAELAGTVQLKKTAGDDLIAGKVRYQIELTEDDGTHKLAGIYDSTGAIPVDIYYGSVEGKERATVVIEVADDAEEVIVKNDNETPDEQTIDLTALAPEKVDNDGPEIDQKTIIRYVTEDVKYLQARFTDATKIYRIEDEDEHDRVLLKEKEQDKDVTIKYVLEDDDEAFIIYDILGNAKRVQLSDAKVETTFNARNVEGTRLAINVTREFTEVDEEDPLNPVETKYVLTGMKTGAGEEIPLQNEYNDIYDGVPAGTTRIILTYTNPDDENDTKTVILPLILDRTGPVTVAYSTEVSSEGKDPLGNDITSYNIKVDNNGSARAYFNRDKGKGIVEVKDMQSGIAKIVTLTGTEGNYEEENVVYNVNELETTVLWLFNVTQETTAVRVYDGVGDYADIPLALDDNQSGTTVATIRKEEDGTYTLIAQDVQAGLGYIQRDGISKSIANFRSSLGYVLPAQTPYGEEQMYHDNKVYTQYTLEKFQMTIDNEGQPIIHVYDALGNETLVDFDKFAFICHYATYNEQDSLSLSVTETRGIWKIVTTICDKDTEEPYPGKPGAPQPLSEPEMPSQPKPSEDELVVDTEFEIPSEEDIIVPPDEGLPSRTLWDAWVATEEEEQQEIQEDDPRVPQVGEKNYDLWQKYTQYKQQRITIKQHEDYVEQQELIAAWEEYELWHAWDRYNSWRENYANTATNTYTLEVFAEGQEPEEFTRTYEIPEGIVEEVRIYNTRGNDELYNIIATSPQINKPNCGQLIDIVDITDADRVTTTSSKLAKATIGGDEKVVGATLTAKYGIKRVTYSDGCVIQFYDELPTELFVNCKVVDEEENEKVLTAVVMDAIGDTATITESGVVCKWETTTTLGETQTNTYNTVSQA